MVAEVVSRWQKFEKQRTAKQNKTAKKFNALSGLNQIEKQKLLASISTDAECQQLLGGDSSALYFNQLFTVNAPLINFELENAFDLQTVLSDDMLVKADRFSMRHGVEIRNPFLDYRVLEFGLNLPQHKKINATTQKIIPREVSKFRIDGSKSRVSRVACRRRLLIPSSQTDAHFGKRIIKATIPSREDTGDHLQRVCVCGLVPTKRKNPT